MPNVTASDGHNVSKVKKRCRKIPLLGGFVLSLDLDADKAQVGIEHGHDQKMQPGITIQLRLWCLED